MSTPTELKAAAITAAQDGIAKAQATLAAIQAITLPDTTSMQTQIDNLTSALASMTTSRDQAVAAKQAAEDQRDGLQALAIELQDKVTNATTKGNELMAILTALLPSQS